MSHAPGPQHSDFTAHSGNVKTPPSADLRVAGYLTFAHMPPGDEEADRKFGAIRRDYKHLYRQESVLRADAVSCVSF